jgi:hypothetical protein
MSSRMKRLVGLSEIAFVSTLGYHICLTISSNCLVQRFLLIVAILYWGPRVILNMPGMVYGCDPGPGMIWTMVHGCGLCVLTQVHWSYDG